MDEKYSILRCISPIAQLRARMALSAAKIISSSMRCGMPSYLVNSTILGSIMMKRTSSGDALNSMLMMMECTNMLLPEPVVPAMRMCGKSLMSEV